MFHIVLTIAVIALFFGLVRFGLGRLVTYVVPTIVAVTLIATAIAGLTVNLWFAIGVSAMLLLMAGVGTTATAERSITQRLALLLPPAIASATLLATSLLSLTVNLVFAVGVSLLILLGVIRVDLVNLARQRADKDSSAAESDAYSASADLAARYAESKAYRAELAARYAAVEERLGREQRED